MLFWDNLISDIFKELKLIIDIFEFMFQFDGIMYFCILDNG